MREAPIREMNVFIFDSPQPILDALEAMHVRHFGPRNHDAHVTAYKSWVRAYGNWEGYHLAMAQKAASRAKLMETADGRAFLDRVAKSHDEWRKSWGK